MVDELLKLSCQLEGDSARDYERLAMVFRPQNYASSRPKQQAVMASAALLALDALLRRYEAETGERYPDLVKILEYAGCRATDIKKALNLQAAADTASISTLKNAISIQTNEPQG
jgi:hypothetical protein